MKQILSSWISTLFTRETKFFFRVGSFASVSISLKINNYLCIIPVTELVDETLSGPTLAAVGEGLTEEELELAKQILEVGHFSCLNQTHYF